MRLKLLVNFKKKGNLKWKKVTSSGFYPVLVSIEEFQKGQWIVPQLFKLLPKRHIFFDLVIRFITNRKCAFFCII